VKRRILVGNSFQNVEYTPVEKECTDIKPELIRLAETVKDVPEIWLYPTMEDTKTYMMQYCVFHDVAITGKMNKTEIMAAIAEDVSEETL